MMALDTGRTELAQALFGKYAAEGGHIYLDGNEIGIRSVRRAVENCIAYVPGNRLSEGLILRQSVANNIVTAVIRRLLRRPLPLIDEEKREEVVERWIKEVSIRVANEDVAVQTLSEILCVSIVVAADRLRGGAAHLAPHAFASILRTGDRELDSRT